MADLVMLTFFFFLQLYMFTLDYLKMRMLYSRRQHLDGLFLFNIFEWKINRLSFMDTLSRRVHTIN
jgi:hypothetical protein